MARKENRFRPELWSMIFFIVPLILAISMRMWPGVMLILLSTSTSVAYHVSLNKKVFYVDRVCTIAAFIFCWVAAILGHFPYPYFPITVVIGAIALGIYFTQEHPPSGYRIKHTIWHVLSALITTMSLVMYLVGTTR